VTWCSVLSRINLICTSYPHLGKGPLWSAKNLNNGSYDLINVRDHKDSRTSEEETHRPWNIDHLWPYYTWATSSCDVHIYISVYIMRNIIKWAPLIIQGLCCLQISESESLLSWHMINFRGLTPGLPGPKRVFAQHNSNIGTRWAQLTNMSLGGFLFKHRCIHQREHSVTTLLTGLSCSNIGVCTKEDITLPGHPACMPAASPSGNPDWPGKLLRVNL